MMQCLTSLLQLCAETASEEFSSVTASVETTIAPNPAAGADPANADGSNIAFADANASTHEDEISNCFFSHVKVNTDDIKWNNESVNLLAPPHKRNC